jgi:hypothetical protein
MTIAKRWSFVALAAACTLCLLASAGGAAARNAAGAAVRPAAGGVLVNGATETGQITTAGQVDSWTFSANAGDRIGVEIGETTDNGNFDPWIRLFAPNGASIGDTWGYSAASLEAVAPASGTYLVLVASNDGNHAGTGNYELTMAQTPGPITISPGDEGGPLTNGATASGQITTGDLDTWTFTAKAGQRLGVEIGEITDNGNFDPWIRIWAPNGASIGDTWGYSAASLEAVAPASGTYLVLVASNDGNHAGTGAYRLTMTQTHGKLVTSQGDQGGKLRDGAIETGQITTGDLDVWKVKALAGQRLGVEIGETSDSNGSFDPWIRIWAPNGASIGNTWGYSAASLEAVAPVSGTYLVLVASNDGNHAGTGSYQLTLAQTGGSVVVSHGDEGGPLTSGVPVAGAITTGDLDVYTISATAGQHISAHLAETLDNGNFDPWIRIWAPNGASIGDTWGYSAADLNNLTAPVSGTYLVLVASNDGNHAGTGTYSLEADITP